MLVILCHVYELCPCWPKVILFINTTKSNIKIIFHCCSLRMNENSLFWWWFGLAGFYFSAIYFDMQETLYNFLI